MHRVLQRQLRRLGLGSDPPTAKQWGELLERIDRAYVEADQDRYTMERSLDLSSAEMRKRFTALRTAQHELVVASRRAGMADVATNVLHNIGNVLNSVNLSVTVLLELAGAPSTAGLAKSVALLGKQAAPGRFLDEDPRGKKLLEYIGVISAGLTEDREEAVKELTSLTKNIDHIRKIVSHQLATARSDAWVARPIERVNLCELLDDAVAVVRATPATASSIEFARDGESLSIETDRHSLFQIIMNLMTNARDALDGRSGKITIATTRCDDGLVSLSITDDGVGIASADIERVFAHGFTTKVNGHGFGLHSSACTALELGGWLNAASGGPGKGATFTLVLPASRRQTTSTIGEAA